MGPNRTRIDYRDTGEVQDMTFKDAVHAVAQLDNTTLAGLARDAALLAASYYDREDPQLFGVDDPEVLLMACALRINNPDLGRTIEIPEEYKT